MPASATQIVLLVMFIHSTVLHASFLRSHAAIDEWAPAIVIFTSGSTATPKARFIHNDRTRPDTTERNLRKGSRSLLSHARCVRPPACPACRQAVPLTHAGLMWTAESKLASEGHDAAAAAGKPHSGSVCMLPAFHVISLVCNVIFNHYVGTRVIVDAGAARRPLSPEIVYEARSR